MRGRAEGEDPRSEGYTQQKTEPLAAEINIIQYNCGNANYKLARSFFDQLDPTKHHLVAVQEPYHNKAARTTYCPPGYTLCYQPADETRVCFLVSKGINTQDWRFQSLCSDVATVTVQSSVGWINVINAYNPSPTTPRSYTPSRLHEINTALESSRASDGGTVFLSDFNLYHPI